MLCGLSPKRGEELVINVIDFLRLKRGSGNDETDRNRYC